VDRTAPSALRTVLWDASIAFAAERCLKIRAHQDVVFDGDFDAHPLEPLGGDMPSPFSGGHWSFSRPGVFGYICSIHSEMTGAIWVVP
jgi:plastocyanin